MQARDPTGTLQDLITDVCKQLSTAMAVSLAPPFLADPMRTVRGQWGEERSGYGQAERIQIAKAPGFLRIQIRLLNSKSTEML